MTAGVDRGDRGGGIEIREIPPGELRSVISLWEAAGLPHRPRGRDSPESLARQFEDDHVVFLGAYSGGRLVGVTVATFDGRKGWINRLAVHPDFRRRGIGSSLVRAAEAALAGMGAEVFSALVEEGNEASLSLFRSLGYEVRRDIVYVRRLLRPDA